LTVVPRISCFAITAVTSNKIHTGGSVLAGIVATLVYICFTVISSISGLTITAVTSLKIDTGSSVLAWAVGTLIYIVLTVVSMVSGFTATEITPGSIRTNSTVFTRARNFALIYIHLATFQRLNTIESITASSVDSSDIVTLSLAFA